MPATDGIIRQREKVGLKDHACKIVEKLYDRSLFDKAIVEKIGYISDELLVRGYMARPKAAGTYPVLIWNRGGHGDNGALSDLTAYLVLASTAAWGYVVLATHYRGNRQSEGIEDWGGSDLNDILNMVRVAENVPECDVTRLAIEGASRGGMNTYRALATKHDFKCAIVHAGITDVRHLMQARPDFRKIIDRYFGKLPNADRNIRLDELSATHIVHKYSKDCPILIMHGDRDETVPIEQSELLVKKLKALDIPHKYIRIEGGTHIALKDGTYKQIDDYRREWLARHLG